MDEYNFVLKMEDFKKNLINKAKQYKKRDIVEYVKNSRSKISIFYGLRGIGKSTALGHIMSDINAMYIDGTTLDYFGFDILDIIKEYSGVHDYKTIVVDELTQIPKWDKAFKILYDNYNYKIIATSSSSISIMTSRSAILRRAVFREVQPLSFREYLRLFEGMEVNISPEEVLNVLSSEPSDAYVKIKPLLAEIDDLTKQFRKYLFFGYPMFKEIPANEAADQVIEKIILSDLPKYKNFEGTTLAKAKKIIYAIAMSKPDSITLDKLANIAKCSKSTAMDILDAFVESTLIVPVFGESSSVKKLGKEPKYLFSSPALRYQLNKNMNVENIGPVREDSFVSTMKYAGFNVSIPKKQKHTPDYVVDFKGKKSVFEIGGPSKKNYQLNSGFLAIDSMTLDYRKNVVTIPLFFTALIL